MSEISARDALRYATDGELLKLYGVLVVGWTATLAGQFVTATVVNPAVSLVAVFVALGGVLALFVGVVAIAHKLLVES